MRERILTCDVVLGRRLVEGLVVRLVDNALVTSIRSDEIEVQIVVVEVND